MAYLSSAYCLGPACGTLKFAVVFHSVEKSLAATLYQTLCMDSVLQKNCIAKSRGCKCTTLHLPAGALGRAKESVTVLGRLHCLDTPKTELKLITWFQMPQISHL